jgi:putative salt-induced outer membrane protein
MLARFIFAAFFGLTATGLTGIADAQDTKGWGGEIGLNGARTTGNNDTTDIGIAFKLNNRGSDWRHNLRGSADYGRSQGNTNKRRYRLSYKIGRDLAPRTYAFANADYYSEDFGAFKHGYYLGGGAGYSVLVDDPTQWRLEAGAGFRSQKARLKPNDPSGLSSRLEEFASARLFSDFEHKFHDTVTFTNDTELFYSDVDTYFINETGVNSHMFGSLALRASFRVEAHTDVPDGREKVDTISRIGIVYKME